MRLAGVGLIVVATLALTGCVVVDYQRSPPPRAYYPLPPPPGYDRGPPPPPPPRGYDYRPPPPGYDNYYR
jgi:hypothetical protein